MNKEPIEVFESKEQFKACCKEWQERLFLNNWFIKFNLTTEEIKDEHGNILWGVCTHMTEGSAAVITIYNDKGFPSDAEEEDMWLKPCAELTLIHELLHLQFEYDDATADTDNETLRAHLVHSSLERMAKTLLMTKYDLDKDWFFMPEDEEKDEEDTIDLKDVAYGKS